MLKPYLKRNAILFGVVTALACIVFFVALYFITPNPLGQRRPDLGFNVIFIFAALYLYKRKTGGYLHFYEGVSIGFVVNIVAALLTGIFLLIFTEVIDNKPFMVWLEEGKKMLIAQKEAFSRVLDEANMKRQLESLSNAKTYQLFLDELMFKQMAIIPISLFSIILRRQRPTS